VKGVSPASLSAHRRGCAGRGVFALPLWFMATSGSGGSRSAGVSPFVVSFAGLKLLHYDLIGTHYEAAREYFIRGKLY